MERRKGGRGGYFFSRDAGRRSQILENLEGFNSSNVRTYDFKWNLSVYRLVPRRDPIQKGKEILSSNTPNMTVYGKQGCTDPKKRVLAATEVISAIHDHSRVRLGRAMTRFSTHNSVLQIAQVQHALTSAHKSTE